MMSQGAFVRHGLTQAECETEALFQILAGSDTTATAIRATLLHIITTPRVYQALKKEISEGIRYGKISKPITYDEARKLPYLQVRSIPFFPPSALKHGLVDHLNRPSSGRDCESTRLSLAWCLNRFLQAVIQSMGSSYLAVLGLRITPGPSFGKPRCLGRTPSFSARNDGWAPMPPIST